jgi:hypothetical protein
LQRRRLHCPAQPASGHPDLSGISQAKNPAKWDLQAHAAAPGNEPSLGALFAVAPGPGAVEGGKIPYRPLTVAKHKENYKNRWTEAPEIQSYQSYMRNVPRANYMPYPFQIIQSNNTVLMSYELTDAVRLIYMYNPRLARDESWMGWSTITDPKGGPSSGKPACRCTGMWKRTRS